PGKTIVFGIKQREGRMHAEAIPDAKKATLRDIVTSAVEPGSIVSTDEFVSYGLLTGDGYKHGVVRHSEKEWTYSTSPTAPCTDTILSTRFGSSSRRGSARPHTMCRANPWTAISASSPFGRTGAGCRTRCSIF